VVGEGMVTVGRVARRDLTRQVLEIGALDVARVADLAGHEDRRRRQVILAVGPRHHLGIVGGHAFELPQEIEVEIRTAEFAVRHRLQADILLEPHDLGDGAVLDGAQGGGVDLAPGMPVTRLQQIDRPQETADVVGAKRRNGACGHRGLLGGNCSVC